MIRTELNIDTIAQKTAIVDRVEALAKFTPRTEVIIPNYAYAVAQVARKA